ncbi:MAG: peptidylprolyl isomerase [Candidatus Moraniibacteriota bacterium]
MRRKIFGTLLIAGAMLLSGCATPEVRKDAPVKDDLSFYPDASKSGVTAPQASPGNKTPQAVPATPPVNTLTNKKMYTTAPQMAIDKTKTYSATLKTDAGDIVIDLDTKAVPITVNNFVFLAREKFYDHTIFHRTIKGFMIQGGDPEGTGAGGPGYQFVDEPFAGEYTRGTLAMANAGANTNGSQFFIMHRDTALPKNYVIFGHVTTGLDVVDKIAEAPTQSGGEGSAPVTPVVVQTITVKEK